MNANVGIRVAANTLNGSLSIIGQPCRTGIKVTPAGNVTGQIQLDHDGTLHVHGTAPVGITITSLLGIPFGECKALTSMVLCRHRAAAN